MLNWGSGEIYIIRGGESQIPSPLPDAVVVVSDDTRHRFDLNQFLSGGSPPYNFDMLESVLIANTFAIEEFVLNKDGVVNLQLSNNYLTRNPVPTTIFLIRITDSRHRSIDVELNIHVPPIFQWRDGMNPKLLDEFMLDYNSEHNIGLNEYYEGGLATHIHFKSDSLIDHGGEIVTDLRPRGDVRNFTETPRYSRIQDEAQTYFGDINPQLSFKMPESFASIRAKVEIIDDLGRTLEGWFQFYSNLVWYDFLPSSFEFVQYTVSEIDLHAFLNSGRQDDEIEFSILQDEHNVFDFIHLETVHNGMLRFNGINSELEGMISTKIRAVDRAYSNRFTDLELTIDLEIPTTEQRVVFADTAVLGTAAATTAIAPPTGSVFDTLSEMFEPPPIRTVLPEIEQQSEQEVGRSYPFVFDISEYIMGGEPPYEFYIKEINELTQSYIFIDHTDPTVQIDLETGIITYSPVGNYFNNQITIVLEVVDRVHQPSETASQLAHAYAEEPEELGQGAVPGAPPAPPPPADAEEGEEVEVQIDLEDNINEIGKPDEDKNTFGVQTRPDNCGPASGAIQLRNQEVTVDDLDPEALAANGLMLEFNEDGDAVISRTDGRPITTEAGGREAKDEIVIEANTQLSIEDITDLSDGLNIYEPIDPDRAISGGSDVNRLVLLFQVFGLESLATEIVNAGHLARLLEVGNMDDDNNGVGVVMFIDSTETWIDLEDRSERPVMTAIDEEGYGINPIIFSKIANLPDSDRESLSDLDITIESGVTTLDEWDDLTTEQKEAYSDILEIDSFEDLVDLYYDAYPATSTGAPNSDLKLTQRVKGADHIISATGLRIDENGNLIVVINDTGRSAGGGVEHDGEEFFEATADGGHRAAVVNQSGDGVDPEITTFYNKVGSVKQVTQTVISREKIAANREGREPRIDENSSMEDIIEVAGDLGAGRYANTRTGRNFLNLADDYADITPDWDDEQEYLENEYNLDIGELDDFLRKGFFEDEGATA